MPAGGTVAAIIPTWNRADLLASALATLAAQDYPVSRTIVVDDGSTDESAEVARRAGATVVRSDTNRGFAASVNLGVRHTEGADWVLILNNDVELDRSWVRNVLAASTADAGFAVGKLLIASDRTVI